MATDKGEGEPLSTDLVQFLRDRFSEDERIARGCEGMEWWEHPENWVSAPPLNRVALAVHDGNRRHIVEHDPARVLREIDAKRQLVDLHPHLPHPRGGVYCECMAADGVVETDGSYCDTLRLLALPYADRPGYREEWRP